MQRSQTNSSDYYDEDDSSFFNALEAAVLPGDVEMQDEPSLEPPPATQPFLKHPIVPLIDESPQQSQSSSLEPPPPAQPRQRNVHTTPTQDDIITEESSQELEPPPATQPSLKRQRLEAFEERERLADNVQDNDIYGASRFGDYGEYMRRKRAKLQIQNAALRDTDDASGGGIFKGLSIYINGYTQPSVQELRELIVKHGGVFQPYLDRKALVTHILTCSLTPAKIREFKHMKVVRPEWLVESAKAGVLLPWQGYIFIPVERPHGMPGPKAKQSSLSNSIRPSGQPDPKLPSTTTTTARPRTPVPALSPVKAPTKPTKPISSNRLQAIQDALNHKAPAQDKGKGKDNDAGTDAQKPKYAEQESNPNAARVMANPEWRKAHTSVAPDFIEGFYKNSRLHHLSMWKAELRNLVLEAQERAEAGEGEGLVGVVESEEGNVEAGDGVSMKGAGLVMRSPTKGKGKEKAVDNRVIMHCDFDCFFVSAGLVSRPQLRGKPVVVCHSQGAQGGLSSTSEIASASYEARNFGVKNGMSLQQARKLCPTIMTIPYEFDRYKQFSLKFYTILMSHADDVQAVSVDEALIDVSSTVTQLRARASQDSSTFDPAKDFAETIRAQVRKATGCEVSIGVSHNILLARLATRHAKPAGSYHIVPADVPAFLSPLDIADLHGFGSATKQKALEKLGTTTLGELLGRSKNSLCDVLGKATGETLYNAIRGVDERRLESDKPRKSVSCDINYGIRFESEEQAEVFVHQMATEITKRLDDGNMLGRSIILKVMKRSAGAPVEGPKFLGHGRCDMFNKQSPLIGPGGRATNDEKVIGDHAWRLLRSFNFDPKDLRGIGIQIQKLESPSEKTIVQPGQAMLPFKLAAGSSKKGEASEAPEILVQPRIGEVPDVVMRDVDPTKPSVVAPVDELPAFSQLDMSVFDALPAEVRQELEVEYQRRSVSPNKAGPAPAYPPPAPPPPVRRPAPPPPGIFPRQPQKLTVKGTNFKRVAQQLAPRNPPSVSPYKSWLFNKPRRRAGEARVPEATLREYGFDPEVFSMLPPNVQHEQLAMVRIIRAKGAIPSPPSKRKELKARKRKPIPPHLLWRAPAPRARWVHPPILRQQGKTKKEKLFFSETDDIQGALEKWVDMYRRWAPKEEDIEFFTKYLLQSVDGREYTDVGVMRAVAVMKWWLVLLRRHWGGSELIEEEDEIDPSEVDPVGQAWWETFRNVKEKMDVVARKKFGGRLSLK